MMGKSACTDYIRPGREQELILRAALLKGEKAWDAWEAWKRVTDFDSLDGGSYRLLPMVYRNLQNPGDPAGRIKGVYLRTWYQNQLLFHRVSNAIKALRQHGIPVMLLKGGALVLSCYRDMGIRLMNDLDILVPPETACESLDILTSLGWRTPWSSDYLPHRHSLDLADSDGCGLDLHWRAFLECPCQIRDDDLWEGAVPLTIGQVSVKALNPTDQLLEACIHGCRLTTPPSIHWIADAMTLLRTAQAEIEWQRLCAAAVRRNLILPLKNSLGYLREIFSAPVPASVLEELKKSPVSRFERTRFRALSCRRPLLGSLPAIWINQRNSAVGFFDFVRGFPRTFQYELQADNLRKTAAYALLKAGRRLGRTMAGHQNKGF